MFGLTDVLPDPEWKQGDPFSLDGLANWAALRAEMDAEQQAIEAAWGRVEVVTDDDAIPF